jgi:NADPH2:quinone reductase
VGRRRGRRRLRVCRISNGELEIAERSTPEPTADRVLVKIAGSGVNRADLLQRRGRYAAPPGWPADVPGLEHAGTVSVVGESVSQLRVGQKVFGIVGGGAHASHLLTPESLCAPLPDELDPAVAGGIPEAFITAHDALVTRAGLRSGERVLIHGVGSGVGTAAVQIARALGARTVGTSRTSDKLERAADLGLDQGVLADENMAERIGEVDVVIDLIGGSYLEVDVEVCARKGRIVIVGLVAGPAATLDMGAVMSKRLTIAGTVLRSRPDHEKAIAVAAFAKEIVPLLQSEALRAVVDRMMPLDRAQEAYDVVESNATFGKVILTPGEDT